MDRKVAIIGCGNLGIAILEGLLDSEYTAPENITATRRNVKVLKEFEERGVVVTSNNKTALGNAELILVALKPHNILTILEELRDEFIPGKHILVSLATGISIEQLGAATSPQLSIFRAMPNTAAFVNESLTCICANTQEEKILNTVRQMFDGIGEIQFIEEELMEAATVLGACGIAYVLRFMRAMVQGGIQIGFSSKVASFIVNQTVNGASKLLIENGAHPEQEIDKVTTPKGCTIEGLNEMEHNGFSSALIKGIVTSFEKIEK
jgi:pyrroline-5-carboxylate reductase